MHRAIFMDRDGTVSEDVGYMDHAGLYKVFSWTGPAIRKINDSGMKAVLITNQSGVGRGYFDEADVDKFIVSCTPNSPYTARSLMAVTFAFITQRRDVIAESPTPACSLKRN